MEIVKEPLNGLLIIKPDIYEDERGFFLETWQQERYRCIGIKNKFVQDNWSRSFKGVLRGLHYQRSQPQGKLVSVRRGRIFDVAVDLRKNSKTFGVWYGEILSDKNHVQMYSPPGFAHGFSVLSECADVNYKCTAYYQPNDEYGIIWNDQDLAIDWMIKNPIISEKDKKFSSFSKIKASNKLPKPVNVSL
ncbi:MAG: dTDP-4-dehydrorhamnose 3,5-epimerase [Candidatus Marinimicrobia bacterium]|nr:dTDP-4-dehydrorhamnose 3,5-epimerase [Candidatus Neomarinimicrobiota bacterium]MCF7828780.1 dTDP-4-dehydrorhamnose 3,5-epimerase [Candidatus Neomarinimicrobiota bacterium]MCF7880697.1 dTDP-4-dehydrorhamnose 3,5-epimerase [Candidatus Neomarinimicrobiota bacterium]